jgi:hypothetical protein
MAYDGHPYWELGRIGCPGNIIAKPDKLETELLQFVNEHPETFSPEEMENIKRGIISAFAMYSVPFVRSDYIKYKPGLSCIAQFILGIISDKTTKGREINTTQDVMNTLTNFEVCVEFINKFLPDLCKTEDAYTQSGNGGFIGSNKWKCEHIAHAVSENWPHFYPNIFKNFQSVINRYQARILQLWADVLIHEGKIIPAAIAQMKTEVDAKDGYERKMRALIAECGGGFSFKPNLDKSMLLKWLTLFHVAIANDPYMTNLTKKYDNEGRASTLDGIVFGIISQFVPVNNVSGYSYIPQSNKHESKLNMLHLTCKVVGKNPPVSGPNAQQPPVYAYLSSDVLDQCVQSVRRFPSTGEFIQYMNTRMIEKAAAFSAPPPPPPPPPPVASAPLLSDLDSELGGGKRTRRKTNKKLKNVKKSKKCKKSKKSRRRFIKRHSR